MTATGFGRFHVESPYYLYRPEKDNYMYVAITEKELGERTNFQ